MYVTDYTESSVYEANVLLEYYITITVRRCSYTSCADLQQTEELCDNLCDMICLCRKQFVSIAVMSP